MICESVERHVVNYGGKERLALIGLVNKETGEESDYNTLYHWAQINGVDVPKIYPYTVAEAKRHNRPNEGYVLSWSMPGKPPLKVKIKFQDYLRLRRIVKVTPKEIFEMVKKPNFKAYLDEFQNPALSTPEFAAYVTTIRDVFENAYLGVVDKATAIIYEGQALGLAREGRKAWAEFFRLPKNLKYAGILFAMLDQKDYSEAVWKLVEPLAEEVERPVVIGE